MDYLFLVRGIYHEYSFGIDKFTKNCQLVENLKREGIQYVPIDF